MVFIIVLYLYGIQCQTMYLFDNVQKQINPSEVLNKILTVQIYWMYILAEIFVLNVSSCSHC